VDRDYDSIAGPIGVSQTRQCVLRLALRLPHREHL
jgi:hypothetical protein